MAALRSPAAGSRPAGAGDRCLSAARSSCAPGPGRAYWSLANLKTFRFAAADLAAMEEQLAPPERARCGTRTSGVRPGQGDSRTTRGTRAPSSITRAATRCSSATLVDNPEAATAQLERSTTAEHRGLLQRARRAGAASGATRSSSSGCRVRARHCSSRSSRVTRRSRVHASLPEMTGIVRELMSRTSSRRRLRAIRSRLAQLTREEIAGFAALYLERTQVHRPLGKTALHRQDAR